MEEFLKKTKLIDDFIIFLNVDKNKFATALRNQVDEKDIDGLFSSAFEVFSTNKKRYKGFVNFNEFKIRKKRSFGNRKFGNIKAIGRLSQNGEKLKVSTKINGWNNFMLFYFGITLVFYTIFIFFFLSNIGLSEGENSVFYIFIPFIIIHALLMFGLPIYQIRKGVASFKRELEREFHFIVSKINH